MVHLDYTIPLWGVIVYILGQISGFVYLLFSLYNKGEQNKNAIKNLESNYKIQISSLKEDVKNSNIRISTMKAEHKEEMEKIKSEIKHEVEKVYVELKETNKEIRTIGESLASFKTTLEHFTLSNMKNQRRQG